MIMSSQLFLSLSGRDFQRRFGVKRQTFHKMVKAVKCQLDYTVKRGKKPKNGELSSLEKGYNRFLAKERIIIEHINRRLKIFKIVANRYRNRRRRYGLRCNLLAAIYNNELTLSA